MQWRLGYEPKKLVRPSLPTKCRPRPPLLSPLGAHVAIRTLRCRTADPGVERLGTPSAATIHPRRLGSLERSWSEEGRIGSWALPLKRSHACLSSPSSPVA